MEMADPLPPLAPAPTLLRTPSNALEIDSDDEDVDEVLMVDPPPPLTRPAQDAGSAPATSDRTLGSHSTQCTNQVGFLFFSLHQVQESVDLLHNR